MHKQLTPHFNSLEFNSPDEKYSGLKMNIKLLHKLESLRVLCGFQFFVNSGYRTQAYNKKIGGSPNSSHLRGLAVDIKCLNSVQRFAIIRNAFKVGFSRVGVYKTFIHLDVDTTKAQGVIWHG